MTAVGVRAARPRPLRAPRFGPVLACFLASLALTPVANESSFAQTPSPARPAISFDALSLQNVSREELDRFLAASMMFAMPDQQKIVAYEMVTRCSIEIPVETSTNALGQPALYSLGREYVSAVAPAIAANTAIEITTLLSGGSQMQQDRCTDRIRGYFGSQYEIDGAELRPLAQRAIEILKGSPLDRGPNQIADSTARSATAASRDQVASHIKNPLFVGAVRAPGRIAVFVGEPGATVRWVVQFFEIDGGRYLVEGGMEAGLIDVVQ